MAPTRRPSRIHHNGWLATPHAAIDSVRYGVGATRWLAAVIVTGAGRRHAGGFRPLRAAIAVGHVLGACVPGSSKATPKTIKVVLTMGTDAPSAMAIDSGDAQTRP